MGYYVLVEKDSKVMQKCWKWLIIFLLITILISCLLSSYSFSALTVNFNDNCVTGATVTFKRITSINDALNNQTRREAEFYEQKIHKLDKEFRSYYLAKELREADETGAIPKTQIYQFLNSKKQPTAWQNSIQSNSTGYMVPTLPSNDTEFFYNYQINEVGTRWGEANTCLLYYYFPVVEITATIVWIVLIVISRREGEHRSFTVIHKAWRLVIPAVICFGVLAICCVIYAAYLNSQLNAFCNEFKQNFTNNEIPCNLILERFSMKDETIFNVDVNFNVSKTVAYVRIFLWLLSGFVMLLRCILGADFEMQEVEYCTEQLGSALDPQTEEASRVKFIDDSIRRESRERVYKPTTELQTLK